MTLKIGSLQTDITADTSGLVQATAKAEGLFNKIEKSANKAEKANKSFWASYGGATEVIRKNTEDVKQSAEELKRLEKQQGNVNRGMGQLGIQAGQFAGQIQGGASAMLAFSQQSSDVLIVLGQMFPRFAAYGGIAGAIISIGSAVGMGLLPFLNKAKPSTDKLTKSIEDLGKVAETVGKDELVVLTEEIAKLARESEAAARTVVQGGIVDAMSVIEESAKQSKESIGELIDGFLFLEKPKGRGLITYNNKLSQLRKEFKLSFEEATELSGAMRQIEEVGDAESLKRFQRVIDDIAQSGNNKAFVGLANQVREFTSNADDANKKLIALQGISSDISSAAEKRKTIGSGGDLDSRIEEIEQLGESERAAIQREYKEREALILASTQLTEVKRKDLLRKAATDRDAQLGEIATREAAEEDKKQQAVQRRIDAITRLDESETDRIMREFSERSKWIKTQTQLEESELTALVVAARNHRNKEIEKINEREIQNDKIKNQKIQQNFQQQLGLLQAMGAGMSQAMAASSEDGAAKIAGVISGVAQTTSSIVALMKAQAIAQEMGSPSSVSLPEKIAKVASVASIFAGLVTSISSVKKGAGRQHGGITSGSMMHPVNERGLPELIDVGSKQYLMPLGQNGKVTPLQKAGGGGSGSMTVQVFNNAPGVQIRQEQVTQDDLRIYVDGEIAKINASAASGRGDFAKNMQEGFDVRRRMR